MTKIDKEQVNTHMTHSMNYLMFCGRNKQSGRKDSGEEISEELMTSWDVEDKGGFSSAMDRRRDSEPGGHTEKVWGIEQWRQ